MHRQSLTAEKPYQLSTLRNLLLMIVVLGCFAGARIQDAAGTEPRTALSGVYRAAGTNPDGSQYQGMVALTRADDQFRLTWWIGSRVLYGTGELAGRTIVVHWGDKHPVIYSFGANGRLDGKWADGAASETLDLFAAAAAGAVSVLEGRYRCAGRSVDGSRYSGVVSISKRAGQYEVEWKIGTTIYRGTGTLEYNVLTVNWGHSTPVVYAVAPDGTLTGLWDGGRGEETLTPDVNA